MMRKYSVDEIENMRNSIDWMYPTGVVYYQADRTKETEEKLRTYMLAGITPRQLGKKVREHLDRQEMVKEYKAAKRAQVAPLPPIVKSETWTGLDQRAFRQGFHDIITLKPLRDSIASLFR